MSRELDYDRAASILVEAAYYGEKATAAKWGITDRTILNYRNRLEQDSKLSDIFALKKGEFESDWANEIPEAIRSAVRFLKRASNEADPKDPESIHAVAGALKIMAEVGMTKAILDVRLSGYFGEDGAEDRQVDAAPQKLQSNN
jgi:hypothetical protein